MPVTALDRRDHLLHIHQLAIPNLQLDLTSDVWHLEDGMASDLVGLDILFPNRFRPERGRKRIGTAAPSISPALVGAFPGFKEGLINVRTRYLFGDSGDTLAGGTGVADTYTSSTGVITVTNTINDIHTDDRVVIHNPASHRGVYTPSAVTGSNITITSGLGDDTLEDWFYFSHRDFLKLAVIDGAAYIIKSPALFADTGPFGGAWSSDLVDRTVFFNEDERVAVQRSSVVKSVANLFGETGNALELSLLVSESVLGDRAKLTILSTEVGDLRGLWVTDGQKFWIQQEGTWNLKLDLSAEVAAGTEWRMASIADNRVMIVSDRYPPRVIYVNGATNPGVADNSSLAGCIPPRKPGIEAAELGTDSKPSWGMYGTIGGNGALDASTAGDWRVQVRAVNLDDNLESEFVDAVVDDTGVGSLYSELLKGDTTLTLSAGTTNAIAVFPATRDRIGFFGPVVSPRWTHIEVWRTQRNGVVYYLESRIALSQLGVGTQPPNFAANESFDVTDTGGAIARANPNTATYPVAVADSLITAFPAKTTNDTLAGRLPPMCRDVAVLGGVTFCFGKAASTVFNPSLPAVSYQSNNGDSSTLDEYSSPGSSPSPSDMTGYQYEDGDKLYIYDGGIDDAGDEGDTTNTPHTIDGVVSQQKLVSAARISGLTSDTDDDGVGTSTDITGSLIDFDITDPGVADLSNTSAVVRLDFPAPVPTDPANVGDFIYGWFTHVGSVDATVALYAYTDSDSVTATSKITNVVTTTDVNKFESFALTSGFIGQLNSGGSQAHGGWSVRLVSETASGGVAVNEIRKEGSDVSLDMPSGFRADFGNVTNDLRPPRAYIERDFTLVWPQVADDEEVLHSRTDLNAPESFLETPLRLSRRGDVFRRAITVGNVLAVIMDQGVHIIYIDANNFPQVNTVSSSGDGTPWPNSVVVVGRVVVWASRFGPKVLKTTDDPNIEGERGTISILGGDRFRSWFEDAFTNDYDIDAGVDVLNGCVRFRRDEGNEVYQTLQYSYRTDMWTLLDGDNGFIYSQGLNVVAEDGGVRLYSVTDQGTLFEVNRSYSDPTAANNVTSYTVTGSESTRTTTAITGAAASSFNEDMLGESARVISSDFGRNDTQVTITAVTGTTDITWTPALSSSIGADDILAIGSVHFRVKYAPLAGQLPGSMKTLMGTYLRATEPSNISSITVNSYEDFQSTVAKTGDIDIYNPTAIGKTTLDRVTDVTAQGRSLEVELEQRDADIDFAIEAFEVRVMEERDVFGDRDAT